MRREQLVKIISLRGGEFALTWKSLTIFCKHILFANSATADVEFSRALHHHASHYHHFRRDSDV